MPKQFHPRSRGVHRIACIALYRALLSKCNKIELPEQLLRVEGYGKKVHPVSVIIQKQFRRNRKIESQTLVGAALRIGYEAEELLYNATNGNEQAHSKLLSLVEAWHQQSYQDLGQNAISPPLPHPQSLHVKPQPIPNAPKLLEIRPRPLFSSAINRVRSVPKLVSANGVPFLRYHKKQSPFLTRVINDKRMTRTKRHETMNAMHAQGETGSVSWAEDMWDGLIESSMSLSSSSSSCSGWGAQSSHGSSRSRIMENRGKNKDKRDGLGTWRESFLLSERHQSTMLNVEKARNRRYALKMTQILEEEQRLQAIEQKAVDNEKRNARNKAKRLRKTDDERKKRREFLDSLSPGDREKEVERFREELAERKRASLEVKAQKLGYAKRYTKEELGEIAGSDWGASIAAPPKVTSRPQTMSPTPIASPTSTRRLSPASNLDEPTCKLDEKRFSIAEKSGVRRGGTKGLAVGENKGGVAEVKPSAEGGFTISWGRGRPDREGRERVWPGQGGGKRGDDEL